MYLITYSTPEKANCFISNRTHVNIVKAWARHKHGACLYFQGVTHKPRYIGYFDNGKLIKP
jgi:hypothetical protein